MIFSVIVLCTIDRAIMWICANTAMIWPRWFISHFVSSHMLLLSRLSRQDLRVNSHKTYCTSWNRNWFWDWSSLLFRDLLEHSFYCAAGDIHLTTNLLILVSDYSSRPAQYDRRRPWSFSFAPLQSLALECRFAPCLPSKSFDDIFKVHIF